MSDVNARCLEVFPGWLRTLGEDGEGVVGTLSEPKVSEGARKSLVSGLNYLFKSLDLIPDGIDDIGYLDDAFVLRVAADIAVRDGLEGAPEDSLAVVRRLADEVALVKEFLGADYRRLETYVIGLRRGSARGRSVDDIVGSADTLAEFVADVRGFARSYAAPSFTRDAKNLITLRAFFDAKLPR
jgi:uncharacterized membrane protein YkvA (DUF1232 family)